MKTVLHQSINRSREPGWVCGTLGAAGKWQGRVAVAPGVTAKVAEPLSQCQGPVVVRTPYVVRQGCRVWGGGWGHLELSTWQLGGGQKQVPRVGAG